MTARLKNASRVYDANRTHLNKKKKVPKLANSKNQYKKKKRDKREKKESSPLYTNEQK
jgi:hypothetical protein